MSDFTPTILTHHVTADAVCLSGYLIDPGLVKRALDGNAEGWDEAVGRVLEMVGEMMQEQIKQVLQGVFNIADLNDREYDTVMDGIDKAAEAIAALPIDRVRAMAVLVYSPVLNVFLVPDMGQYVVMNDGDALYCHRCSGDCEHVQAVRLYLAERDEQ